MHLVIPDMVKRKLEINQHQSPRLQFKSHGLGWHQCIGENIQLKSHSN